MANKYVDTSATYNGDGTSLDQASANGQPGAWNSLVNALKGTPGYGTLTAGDTVYVRTYNGGNLSETLSANCTFNAIATITAPINWIFDDGAIWPTGGQFQLSGGASYTFTMSNYNNIWAYGGESSRLKMLSTYSSNGTILFITFYTAIVSGVYFSSPLDDSKATLIKYAQASSTRTRFYDCYFYIGGSFSDSGINHPVFAGASGAPSHTVLNNCIINLNSLSRLMVIFAAGAFGSRVEMNGGSILNANPSNHYLYTFAANNHYRSFYGTNVDFGSVIARSYFQDSALTNNPDSLHEVILSSRVYPFDFRKETTRGAFEFWQAQNYPTLNATLPDASSTPWSVRIWPSYARPGFPLGFAEINKLYVASPATKTLTFEFLLPSSYSAPKNNEFWVELVYVDNTTGDAKLLNTYSLAGADIATSTAAWSATSFGDPTVNFSKYKIAVATPTAIKQYSQIRASFYVGRAPDLTTDYMFLDPDFTVV